MAPAPQEAQGMSRLPRMAPRVTAMRPALSAPKDEAGRTAHRRKVNPWRAWYNTARWQRLRWSVLRRDLFMCQMCGRTEPDTSRLVADHKTPHRGSPDLFWSLDNLQALCASCHNSAKAKLEIRQGFR